MTDPHNRDKQSIDRIWRAVHFSAGALGLALADDEGLDWLASAAEHVQREVERITPARVVVDHDPQTGSTVLRCTGCGARPDLADGHKCATAPCGPLPAWRPWGGEAWVASPQEPSTASSCSGLGGLVAVHGLRESTLAGAPIPTCARCAS